MRITKCGWLCTLARSKYDVVSYTAVCLTLSAALGVYGCAGVTGSSNPTAPAPVAPSITTQPTGQTVTAGQTATFSVAATGTAPLSYQWNRNGAAIGGANSSSYTTPATTSSDNGAQFAVMVSNAAGSVTSNAATLTVNPAPAQLSATPSSATFPNVVIGTSNSQTITLTNGGGSSTTISQASVSGTGFSITGLPVPTTIAAGTSSTFNVLFAPTTAGSVTGSVSLASNAPGSPLAIPLNGTGVASTLLLGANPNSLSFGNVNVGASSSQSSVLTNTGNSNVTISSATATGSGFSVSGVSAGTILAPNQTVTLNVVFTPTASGSVTGSVSVASNATNSPTTITLIGAGIQTTSHFVNLSWTASTSPGVAYNVYRGTVSGGPYAKLNSAIVPGTTYTDSTVASGQTYFYVVTAVDSNNNESIYSNQVSAAVP